MIILRKCLVAILGGTLLLAGVAMLVLPGPAVVVIPAALAVLAIEFLWARHSLAWLRRRCQTVPTNKPASCPTFNRVRL
jgi:tellurite resistance protein TerC